jgi:hypothetical protein
MAPESVHLCKALHVTGGPFLCVLAIPTGERLFAALLLLPFVTLARCSHAARLHPGSPAAGWCTIQHMV